ncbi:hypothetical protein [Solirubrobacter soli]|uniref:hypothetical protein n=1 Tax=Solirubrobacter soli TaxID=363832 RepID=UPI0003F70A89|nr:hypothetical protein [Solirubrobacter soli]
MTELAPGTFVLTEDKRRRFAGAVLGDPDADPSVDALWIFTSGLHGMGMDLTEVFASVGCSMVDDGPMLGGIEFELTRPIEVGRTYIATGAILGVERKTGRRTGAFDLMRMRVALSDDAGEAAAATTTYILPVR